MQTKLQYDHPAATNTFTAVLESQDHQGQVSLLLWQGLQLRAPIPHELAAGPVVHWSIAPDQVRLLSNTNRPMGPDDTPFLTDLIEVADSGTMVRVTARITGDPTTVVLMEADAVIAREHGVRPGARLTLRLRGRSIRIAPGQSHQAS